MRVVLLSAVLVTTLAGSAAAAQAAQYHPYFGDLHTQTGDSNGRGTPAQAFAAAKAAGADYMAVTDHAGRFDAGQWEAQRAAAAAATTADFAALNGYEVTMGWGHVNVYNETFLPTVAELEAMAAAPSSLYDWLVQHPGAIAQWNHPTYKSNDFSDFADLTPERRAVMCAVEVQNDGHLYESSYAKALDRGWEVMPSADSDTHEADWISGHPERTVLLADRLTPAALIEALQARRGYATAISDLRVMFRGNGAIMGSTLAEPRRITFTMHVSDPRPRRAYDSLRRVALVSDGGKVVAQKRVAGYAAAWSPTVTTSTAVPGGAQYFFLRVSTASGPCAWTAPIWTGMP